MGLVIILLATLIVLGGLGIVVNNLIRLRRELAKPVSSSTDDPVSPAK